MELNAIFAVTKVKQSPGTFAFGSNNDLIVRNSSDMQHFKSLTTGHTLIMGRKTFESLGCKALPDRKMVVISSMPVLDWTERKDCILVRSLKDAITTANELESEKAFVIGGANLIREAMLFCKNIYYTIYQYEHPFSDKDVFLNMNLLLGTKMFMLSDKIDYKEECTIVATGEKKVLKFRMLTSMNSDNFRKELRDKSAIKKLYKKDAANRKLKRKKEAQARRQASGNT